MSIPIALKFGKYVYESLTQIRQQYIHVYVLNPFFKKYKFEFQIKIDIELKIRFSSHGFLIIFFNKAIKNFNLLIKIIF